MMNKLMNKQVLFRLCAAVLFAVLALTACASGQAASEAPQGPDSPQAKNVPTYWTGDGADGLGIAVLTPEGKGLAAGEAYLPAMVQGVIVGDFTKFSAMEVLDRQNLDKIIAEGESGAYADESGFVQLGTVANVQYVLNGALQKTGSGFSLQLKVTEAASGVSKAAYTGSCTAAELENLTGIKKASADLLAALGVTLTDAGKTGLLGVTTENVQAETALARGVTAQRSGTVVEAMSYYYEAARFDPNLAEAASRSSVLYADITGGNIGQNVRNDIQRRAAYVNTWTKTLNEAAAFFKAHPPYEIVYDPALTQGEVDYAKGTVDMSFEARIIGTTGLKVIHDLSEGLEIGKRDEWGVNLSVDSIFSAIPEVYEIAAALLDENGKTIGSATGKLGVKTWGSYRIDFSHGTYTLSFENVDANKITDKMTVSIVSVNGIDAKTAGQRGYISISAVNFVEAFTIFDVAWHFGDLEIIGYKGSNRSVVIPSKIGRWPVTSIKYQTFYNKRLASVVIPNSVTAIGDGTFSDNQLNSVTIPDSVTSIGHMAFENNQLTSVTIGNDVTSIGSGAFMHNQLTSVTIGNGVISIGNKAFNSNRLDSVTIPDSVTSIGDYAFSSNELTSVTIGNGVTSIGEKAFDYELISVTLPANVQLGMDAIPCKNAYENNRKKAGTYTRPNAKSYKWKYKP
jgi:hypothetical protein